LNSATDTIGRYQLVTRLAVGGMAEIFLACERGLAGLERQVVIKRILPHLAEQQKFLDMFLREARIVARLNHRNVVQIHELGHDNGQYFLVMEYLEGLTTRELFLLAREAGLQLPVNVVVEVLRQACRGLHAMHEARDLEGQPLGLVHRDVSPQNVMITLDGHIKLVDFGIAKATEGLDATYTGSLKGKFSYMSPEQCLNEPLDRRSDIFTLGILLWELATTQRLFKRKSEMEMLTAVTEGQVPLPSSIRPDFPSKLEPVLLKALERDREARFQTADEMRLALNDVANELNLGLGHDHVRRFVETVGGGELRDRLAALNAATERTLQSIDRDMVQERQPSPSPLPVVDDSGDVPTVVASPKGSTKRVSSRPVPIASPPPRQWVAWSVVALLAVVLGVTLSLSLFQDRSDSTPTRPGSDVALEDARPVFDGPPIRFGWPPYVDPTLLLDDVAALRIYLEDTLERPVEFIVTDTYAECGERLIAGDFDYAALPPLLYVRTVAAEPGLHLLSVKEFDGAASYEGWLMARQGSGILELPDLEGRRFCLTDPNSTSGYFLPRAHLRRNGYDPDQFMGEVHWSGQHLQAIRDLLADRCDAVATYNGAVLGSHAEADIGRLTFIATTGTIPQDVIVARADIEPERLEHFAQALLDLAPEEDLGIPRIGTIQRITGFKLIDDEAFQPLRLELEHDEGHPDENAQEELIPE